MPSEILFSHWLNTQLAKKDITPVELADIIETSSTTVYSWLRGASVPTPSNRKLVVEALDEIVPQKILFTTPLFGYTCSKCDYYDECFTRVNAGLPMMCESLALRDLMVAFANNAVQEVIWWCKVPECKDIDDIAYFLEEERKSRDDTCNIN